MVFCLSVCLLDQVGRIIWNNINQISISGPGTRGQTRSVGSSSRLQFSQTQETQGLSLEFSAILPLPLFGFGYNVLVKCLRTRATQAAPKLLLYNIIYVDEDVFQFKTY